MNFLRPVNKKDIVINRVHERVAPFFLCGGLHVRQAFLRACKVNTAVTNPGVCAVFIH